MSEGDFYLTMSPTKKGSSSKILSHFLSQTYEEVAVINICLAFGHLDIVQRSGSSR